MVCVDDDNLLGENINGMKKNTEVLLITTKDICLEIKAVKKWEEMHARIIM
jgi:hypothetical protein